MNQKTHPVTRGDSSQIFLGVVTNLASVTLAALAGYAFFMVLFMTIFLEAGLSGDPHTVFWARIFWALLFAVPAALYFVVLSTFHISYRDKYPVFVRTLWWTTGCIVVASALVYALSLLWNYLVFL